MKFPSIKLLAKDTFNVFKRFPLEVLSALTGTIATTINIKSSFHNHNWDSNFYIRLIMMASLSLLLNLCTTLFTESRDIKGAIKWAWRLAACLLIVALFFLLDPFEHGSADFIRFFLLSLAFHLLVSIAGFIGTKSINGFWQFNRTLFLRFLSSVLYGIVLYLGLAAALASMNFLFNCNFKWDTFSILWTWIVGIFTTIFFLAGVPINLSQLEGDNSYPKGLKIFTQYVLIPLATVYVVILLSYEVKILIEWRLPKGMVSDLILGYAVFGILSLLLVYPIRNLEENKWLKTFARSFYFLMIPLVVLLFLAVGTRIFKYGITEYRYFLIILSSWLLLITVYFLFSKKQNIKLIPVSLCILTLLSVYGPQSAFSVAEFSQKQVLANIFKKYGSYQGGKLQTVKDKKVSKKDGNRAVATLEYLVDKHDLSSLQSFTNKDLKSVPDSLRKLIHGPGKREVDSYELSSRNLDWAKDYWGLSSFTWNRYSSNDDLDTVNTLKTYYIHQQNNNITDIKGYDYAITQSSNQMDSDSGSYKGIKFSLNNDVKKGVYELTLNGEKITFDILPLIQQTLKNKSINQYKEANGPYQFNYSLPKEMLSMSGASKTYLVTFGISDVHFDIINEEKTLDAVNGTYYIKIKP